MKEKKKVEFLEKALEFWLLMHLVSDEPSENLDAAKMITSKAKENKSAPFRTSFDNLCLSLKPWSLRWSRLREDTLKCSHLVFTMGAATLSKRLFPR